MEDIAKQNEVVSVLPEFKLSTVFPYFLPYIVSLGVFRLMVFYGHFGIRIISFLDFSEVIISFMDILIILVLVTGWNVISDKLQLSRKDFEKQQKWRDKVYSTKSEWKMLKRIFKLHIPQLILFALIMSGLSIYVLVKNLPFFHFIYFGLTVGAALMISITRVIIAKRHHDFNASQGQKNFTSTVLSALLYFIIVFVTAKMEANMLMDRPNEKKLEIVLDDKTVIITTSDRYLIGKTSNYLFLYTASKQKTEVIPTNRITSFAYFH